VEQAKELIEVAGLKQLLPHPNKLPLPRNMDACHARWRKRVIKAASDHGLDFTHGVAAKLINIYLKASFVCGGHHNHPRVRALHPPIDSMLLDALSAQNVGGYRRAWNEARKIRWSNFNSEQYETVVNHIRDAMPNQALWEVEKYWPGHQQHAR
jgi:hypothetical protein